MAKLPLYKSIFIFTLVAIFLIFEMGVQVSPSVMTRPLMLDLHLNPSQLGWMSGCYFFTYAFMQIPAGLLYDRFNIRYVISLPIIICGIGVILFSFSTNLWIASLARLLMGTGSAFAFIGLLVVATDIFPNRYFALFTGLAQKLAAFGAVGGQFPLFILAKHLGWREAMLLLGIAGLILSIFTYIFVHYHKAPFVKKRVSTVSITRSIKSVTGKIQNWFIAFYACFLWAPMAGFASLWGVPYLERAYQLAPSAAALAVSSMWLGLAFASPVVGLWSDYLHNRKIPLLACAIIGWLSFTLILFPLNLPGLFIYGLLFLTGASCSGQALCFAVVKDHTPYQYRAVALGFNNMAVIVAGAIFQPLIGKLIAWHANTTDTNPLAYHAGDFQFGLSSIAVVLFIAIICIIFFIKTKSFK